MVIFLFSDNFSLLFGQTDWILNKTFERPTRIGLTSYVPCLKELGGTLYLFMRTFQDCVMSSSPSPSSITSFSAILKRRISKLPVWMEILYVQILLICGRASPLNELINVYLCTAHITYRVMAVYNSYYWMTSNVSLWRRLCLPLSVHVWFQSPTQPMHEMYDRPPQRELHALLLSISVWVL